jgi:uncharacterized membrane protein YgcG
MMQLARWKAMAGMVFLAAILSVPAWGTDTDSRRQALPGTLNYLEGQASMNDQPLDSKAVGNAELENGQVLETGKGKAEILLTPGVYLRIGDNSSVKMISSSLTNTELALDHGEAMLEVDQIYTENNIHIAQPGADTRVLKTGLYAFDASHDHDLVRVFEGKAIVTADDRNTTVKKDRELRLNQSQLKAQGFHQDQVTGSDDLYRWSSLRSEYLSEANVDSAHLFYANAWYGGGGWGPGWWGAGWYWDPWFDGFTFLPAAGFFYNPFGWGFYSPYMVWRAPYFGVHGYQHFDGTRPVAIGRGFNNHAVTSFHGGGINSDHGGGGFHGGASSGGGFHGGGGFGGHR